MTNTWAFFLAMTSGMSIAVPFVAGIWILRPLDKVAENRKAPFRFNVLDFFGLAFLIQVPLALVQNTVPHTGSKAAIATGALVVSVLVWYTAVRTFSRAGINEYRQRAILVFAVLPLAYLGSFAIVVLPHLIMNLRLAVGIRALICLTEIALLAGIVWAGKYTRKVARAALAERPQVRSWP